MWFVHLLLWKIDNMTKKKGLSRSVVGLFLSDEFPKLKQVFFEYIWPNKRYLIAAISFMVLFALMEAASVKILKPIFDEVFIDKNREILGTLALQIMALFMFKSIFHYLQSICMSRVGLLMVKNMQDDLFANLIRQDLSFFSANNTNSLLVYFTGDMYAIRNAVLDGFTSLIRDSCVVVFMVGLMFWHSFEMACVVFIAFPLGVYPVVMIGRRVKRYYKNQQKNVGGLFGAIVQAFQGVRIVKSYLLEEKETDYVKESTGKLERLSFKIACISAISSPIMEFLSGVAIALTLTYGGWSIISGRITPGDFMVFLLAVVAAYKPMKSLAQLNMKVQVGLASIDRVYEAMNSHVKILDAPDAKELVVGGAGIKLDNLVFSYTPDKEVLHNVSFEVKPGQSAAIIGLAGSGKSTIINLLQRFYELDSGSISIEGQDIRSVTIESLRRNIAYVSQDVILFEGSIASNIRLGRQDASDDEVIAAAKRCGAHEFIMLQPQGYETEVGERGGNLSGGQKQLVSIARAMLKDAPILLLDEPTSSLDSRSEKLVQAGLEVLMQGRTTITIAHRLSTIRDSDIIFVMEEGQLLEQGTHQELVDYKGRYAQLHGLQVGLPE